VKLTHIVTPINNGAQIQHRLFWGKHAIAEGLERDGSEAERHLNACFDQYIKVQQLLEDARKQQEQAAAQAQGALALKP
jgi:hypothetical protein